MVSCTVDAANMWLTGRASMRNDEDVYMTFTSCTLLSNAIPELRELDPMTLRY